MLSAWSFSGVSGSKFLLFRFSSANDDSAAPYAELLMLSPMSSCALWNTYNVLPFVLSGRRSGVFSEFAIYYIMYSRFICFAEPV